MDMASRNRRGVTGDYPSLLHSEPLVRVLARFEAEAAVLRDRYQATGLAPFAIAWSDELRAAMDAASRETTSVALAEVAADPRAPRCERTLRRHCRDGKVPGARKENQKWVLSPAAAASLFA